MAGKELDFCRKLPSAGAALGSIGEPTNLRTGLEPAGLLDNARLLSEGVEFVTRPGKSVVKHGIDGLLGCPGISSFAESTGKAVGALVGLRRKERGKERSPGPERAQEASLRFDIKPMAGCLPKRPLVMVREDAGEAKLCIRCLRIHVARDCPDRLEK
jgi:hypothetical protein